MTDHNDDNDNPTSFGGFAFPMPPELAQQMRRHHDMHQMASEDRTLRIFRFLDTLDAEALMTLRMILNQDSASAVNNYFDGMVVTLLRRVHHVDPDTGKPETDLIDADLTREQQ